MLGQHIVFRQRRADNVVNHAAELADFIDVIKLAGLHDVFFVFLAARHAARLDFEAGRVGNDRLLEADLRTIGEARDHGRILLPFLRKSLLRGGIAIRILQSLDVANHARRQAETLDPAIEIHLQAGLVAITGRQDHAMFLGIDLQIGPMVASISAFSRMTSLPCLNASKATRAPNSTDQ